MAASAALLAAGAVHLHAHLLAPPAVGAVPVPKLVLDGSQVVINAVVLAAQVHVCRVSGCRAQGLVPKHKAKGFVPNHGATGKKPVYGAELPKGQ